jgi:hypothetical protein
MRYYCLLLLMLLFFVLLYVYMFLLACVLFLLCFFVNFLALCSLVRHAKLPEMSSEKKTNAFVQMKRSHLYECFNILASSYIRLPLSIPSFVHQCNTFTFYFLLLVDMSEQATWRPQRQHKYSNTRTPTISRRSASAHG